MTGISAVGTYTPRLRIEADEFHEAWGQFDAPGVEQKSVPDADEDAVTMAYEAGRRALERADCAAGDVTRFVFATTTPPMAEENLNVRLASMLGLSETVTSRSLRGDTCAGVDGLVDAISRVDADETDVALVVASDCPRGAPDSSHEHAAGAGAVAFVVDSDGTVRLRDTATAAAAYPGTRFRPRGADETTGLGITQYDRSAYVQTIRDAVDELDVASADVDTAAVQAPDGKLPYRLASPLGLDPEAIQRGTRVHQLGDTGVASPLFGLAAGLRSGATETLVVGFGSGAKATAGYFEGTVDDGLSAPSRDVRTIEYSSYLRRRGDITSGAPAGGGAYVSVPSWKRTLPQRHRRIAGECRTCGTLMFPPSGACSNCGALDDYERVPLTRRGTVEAVTTIGQGGAPPEFVEQQNQSGAYQSAVVAFEASDGRSVSVPAQVVTLSDDRCDVGDDVVSTVRRVYEQEDVVRYGFKVRPATDGE